MSLVEALRYATAAAFTATLLWAAVDDVVNRRISNASVLTVLGLYAAWAILAQGRGLISGLEAGGIALAVGYLLWMFKIVGGGDAKLFAAGALFMGLANMPLYAVVTALSGGVLAVISLATRPRRAMVMLTLRGQGDFGRGIPYGAAIACGGAFALWAMMTTLATSLPFPFSGRL
jgi:prepilin peptidase CpaA